MGGFRAGYRQEPTAVGLTNRRFTCCVNVRRQEQTTLGSRQVINSLIIVFTRGVLFISRPLRSSSRRTQRKIFLAAPELRVTHKNLWAFGQNVYSAVREIFFDCRPLSGNQKLSILCDLCVLCERSSLSLVVAGRR